MFLHINPPTGSKGGKTKGKKTRSGTHESVLALVKDLALFEFGE